MTKDILTFEKAIEELEQVVSAMEQGDQTLEKTIADFEKGVNLINHCNKVLNETEEKITILKKSMDGEVNKVEIEKNNLFAD